ncbi:hypothetical protein SEUCBS140593_005302 [Sporothrix eucalyptigena]|uniref:Aminoglycoside phosphotransferase domain-containing protein n=1 Tax=Sporothrix eucalyptigena TaxID=1812306 RepID=A0ABP0BW69_9PEZI
MLLPTPTGTVALKWAERIYDPDASSTKAMQQTDWPALCRLAKSLRGNIPCVPLDHTTNGLNNMARLLRFDDGVLWVARVAMRRGDDVAAKLSCEVDTMLWIQETSSLPVPVIFAYEVDSNNAVGVPFVLMSFIPGNTAMDSGGGFETHHGVIPLDCRPRFYRNVAEFHVRMAALRLPRIGTVRKTPDGRFEAGPIPGIGGPFDTATAFFQAWADATKFPRWPDEILEIMGSAPEAQKVADAIGSFIGRFRMVVPKLVLKNEHDKGPFPLCHPDFLHSNMIIDDDYSLLGVIDWEGVCTLPLELVRFPRFLDLIPPLFGRRDRCDENGQPYDEDDRQRWQERREYVEMVSTVEAGEDGTLSACLADEHAQALAYAMEGFENGKMGLYDELLDSIETDL